MTEDVPCNIKHRFKGVENFLRRIAFNLGNTPSQTEVKIISCIPIDVTDLQQKIYDLERLVARLHKPPAIVHTALCGPVSTALQECSASTTTSKKDDNISRSNTEQKTITFKNTPLQISETTDNSKPEHNKNTEPIILHQKPGSSSLTILSDNCEKINKKTFFKKSKLRPEKKNLKKPKSHMVYYAHTDNLPFKNHNFEDKTATNVVDKKKLEKSNKKKETKALTNSILADIIYRQYEPLMFQLSGESDFSSPICRDIEYSSPDAAAGSDICSCCRTDFLNIDKSKDYEDFRFTPTFQEQINSQNVYYDSSLYDLVPVKEAPVELKKNLELPKTKKHYKNEIDFSNYIDRPYDRPVFVNYHTIVPIKPRVVAQSIPKRTPTRKTYKRKPPNRRMDFYNEATESVQGDTSNSCRVECGDVYIKPANKNPTPPKLEVKTYNDAETSTFNNTECQTVTTLLQNVENDSILSDDKTGETLNQIKSILQSVLTEVKTNSKLKSPPEEKVKKDAVVQKGASYGIMPGSSRLLNSFSYGAYNAVPYGTSFSHPINSGQNWPNMPYSPKCMHNYPVFIQTPGRLPYSACYRNTSHVSKQSTHKPARQANSASTNTDERTSETEKLIKEIYKSIALNIDIPKKETSASNSSTAWKRSSRTSTKSSSRTDKSITARQGFGTAQSVYGRHTNNSVPSQFGSSSLSNRRTDTMNSVPLTPFSSHTFSNKMTSNTVSVQSHAMSTTDTGRRMRNNRLGHYLDTTQEMPSEESTIMQTQRRPPTASTGVAVESSSDESQSDGSEQTQYVMTDAKSEIQKKEHTNLFSKMIKSVKLFKNRKRKSQKSKIESEEGESDSDDYQTIYSQQVQQARRPPIQIHVPARRIPHSKVSYSRHMRGRNQEKLRRSPMEQEYRRQWNEQVMSQQWSRRSTEQSERSYKGSQRYKKPTKKPVMVEQGIPVQNTMFQDILTTLPQQRAFVRPEPQRMRTRPPKGLSWFKRRMRCGENIVRSLIVNN